MDNKPEPVITFQTGDKIRTFGGWYRHTIILLDGQRIGRIQTRRRNKRNDSLTLFDGDASGVIGQNIPWLVRKAIQQKGESK